MVFGLLYIVLGAGAGLSVIMLSNLGSSNSYIFIHEDCSVRPKVRFGFNALQELIKITEEKNKDNFVLKGAAVTLKDMQESMRSYFSSVKPAMLADELLYALDSTWGKRHSDQKSEIARNLYDLWVDGIAMKLSPSVNGFLKKNGVAPLSGINDGSHYSTVALLSRQGEHLQSILGTFSRGNATILLSVLNGSVRVMNC